MKNQIPTWDEIFSDMAKLIASRSKDPNTQAGAVVVSQDNIILGLGYNGFPKKCDNLPWEKKGKYHETKYAYVVHAEVNAVLNANSPVKDCKIYCTLFPCNECSKILIQLGIKEIYYDSDKYHDDYRWVASRRLLKEAKIKTYKLN